MLRFKAQLDLLQQNKQATLRCELDFGLTVLELFNNLSINKQKKVCEERKFQNKQSVINT